MTIDGHEECRSELDRCLREKDTLVNLLNVKLERAKQIMKDTIVEDCGLYICEEMAKFLGKTVAQIQDEYGRS